MTEEDLKLSSGSGSTGDLINTLNRFSPDGEIEYIPVFPANYSVFDEILNPNLAKVSARYSAHTSGQLSIPTMYGSYSGWRGDSSISGAIVLANNDGDGEGVQLFYKANDIGLPAMAAAYDADNINHPVGSGISPDGVFGGFVCSRTGGTNISRTGNNFSTITNFNVSGISSDRMFDVAFSNSGVVVALYRDSGVVAARIARSVANGVFAQSSGIDWSDISYNSRIQPSTESNDTFYILGVTKIWRTTDGGVNFVEWAEYPQLNSESRVDMSKNGLTVLVVGKDDPKLLFEAFCSKDGGQTWKDISRIFSSAEVVYSRDTVSSPSSVFDISVSPSGDIGVAWCKGSGDVFIVAVCLQEGIEGIGEWIGAGSSQFSIYQGLGVLTDSGTVLALYQTSNGIVTSAPAGTSYKLNDFKCAVPPAEIAGYPKVIGG